MNLVRITHTGKTKTPLRVVFTDADGNAREVDANAGDVQTFTKFQKLVGNVLGIWLEPPMHGYRATERAREWEYLVSQAFRAGRKTDE